ncbi:MAG: hypothetical protein ABFS02_06925 [Pseudomonadota bacterium]
MLIQKTPALDHTGGGLAYRLGQEEIGRLHRIPRRAANKGTPGRSLRGA